MSTFLLNFDSDFFNQVCNLVFAAIPVGVLLVPLPWLAGYVVRKVSAMLSRG